MARGDDVDAVVERVRRVPDAQRVFATTESDAGRVHRIDATLLERLLDLGLPHRGGRDDRRFDRLDLENIGLALRLPCRRWLAMRWWARALLAAGDPRDRAYSLRVTVPCPRPGHPGDCPVTLDGAVSAAALPGTLRPVAPATYELRARLSAGEELADEAFAELVRAIRPVEFHIIPTALTGDLGFLAHAGLADCTLAARYLTDAGRRLGMAVRPASGLFMVAPHPEAHDWIDVRSGDRWVAADPFLLTAFARWGLVDPAAWPAHRSPQAVLWRLDADVTGLATHGGEPADVRFAVLAQD